MNDEQVELAAELRARLPSTDDPEEREQLQNEIAELEGRSLTGDGHQRLVADGRP